MILKDLRIQNFRSYYGNNNFFEFKDGLTLIIGENVKIGKDVRFDFNGAEKLIVVADNAEIPDETTVYSQTRGKQV